MTVRLVARDGFRFGRLVVEVVVLVASLGLGFVIREGGREDL